MMPSQRAAVPHTASAQIEGLCKGNLNRASAAAAAEYHYHPALKVE